MAGRNLEYLEVLALMEEIGRPWSSYIGLVQLRPSEFVTGANLYAIDSSRSGLMPELAGEVGQCVIFHPDAEPLIRTTVATALGRTPSDAELAAFLYWFAHTREGRAWSPGPPPGAVPPRGAV